MATNIEIIEQVLEFLDSDIPSKDISEYLKHELEVKDSREHEYKKAINELQEVKNLKAEPSEKSFSFTEKGRSTKIDGEDCIGVWTDGIMLSSDFLSNCEYRLKKGVEYKITVTEQP